MLNDMLSMYPNLWIDISWTVYEDCIAPDGIPVQEWMKLIERYPDRFLIGSDLTGRFDGYADEIHKYDPLLTALMPETAERIAQENVWKLVK